MGPPSSGAITVLQILAMVERFDMAKLGKDNPESWHVIGEAMQLAYADREKYLGDRDFVEVPVAGLLDPAYLVKRSKLISLAAARSEEHTSELQSLMRISYAVFCLKHTNVVGMSDKADVHTTLHTYHSI